MLYPVPGFPGSFYSSDDNQHIRLTDGDGHGGLMPLPEPSLQEVAAVQALRRELRPELELEA